MSRFGRRIRGFIANRLGILPEYTLACDGSLAAMGWSRSWRLRRSEDAVGDPLPWITYPAIRFLDKRVPAGCTVFEFGAGNSTLWWARRAGSVVACEHDPAWARSLSSRAPAHVRVLEAGDGPEYEGSIAAAGISPDIVVIDGIRREACLHRALPLLSASAVIIWDNADREDAVAGASALRQHGWRSLEFWGLGAINTSEWCTAIWYRDGNILGI